MRTSRFIGLLAVLVTLAGGTPCVAAAQATASTPGGSDEMGAAPSPDSSEATPDTEAQSERSASPENPMPFSGWKVINLPTGRTLEGGNWLFLISHRFNQPVNTGYAGFYGLDSGATMYLSLGYAFTDRLLVTLGRSDRRDNVELETRYGAVHERNPSWPVGLSVQGAVNWLTRDIPGQRRWRSAAFKYTAQVSLTRTVVDQVGLALVPGLTLNPDENLDGETPLVTLGLGARWKVQEKVALVGEWTPVLSRPDAIATAPNRHDTWAAGVEITTDGHVFQVVVSNGRGLTTDQYLSGADLGGDIADGNVRLGFNIFRILDFSKF